MPNHTIHLDGTTLEGGGQLVRLAAGLAALSGQPIRVTDIRGKRRGDGGLKLQHLKAVNWLAEACGADVRGAEKGSKELTFLPGKRMPKNGEPPKLSTVIDITTPGAITLVVQAILPYLLFAGSAHQLSQEPAPTSDNKSLGPDENQVTKESEPIRITLIGGTNVSNSPSIDHTANVLVPTLNSIFGQERVSLEISKRCWSTNARGGVWGGLGEVVLTVNPLPQGARLPAFQISNRGELSKIEAHVLAPEGAKEKIETEIHREVASPLFTKFIHKEDSTEDSTSNQDEKPRIPVEITFTPTQHLTHISVLLIAHFTPGTPDSIPILLASDNLHMGPKPRNPALTGTYVVRQAATSLSKEISSGACIDTYMRDQIVAYQCLVNGKCTIDAGVSNATSNFEGETSEIEGFRRQGSLHAKTAWWVSEKVVGTKFGDGGEGDGCSFVVGNGAEIKFEAEVEADDDEFPTLEEEKQIRKKKGKTGTGPGRAKFGRGPSGSKLLADAMKDLDI